ncbi:MAG: pyrroline-5-carboxylate reductase [Pseudobdellovibrionaceae bacterium]
MSSPSLLFVGCGHMGTPLLQGIDRTHFSTITLLKPSTPDVSLDGLYTHYAASAEDLAEHYDIILLAVKPQQFQEAALSLRGRFTPETLFISVMAGKTIMDIGETLNLTTNPIIRAMPNIPAQVGAGITVLYGNAFAHTQARETATGVFKPCGETLWLAQENLIDTATALSGSGPAYFFLTLEALSAAGQANGLTETDALKLASTTLRGVAALIDSAPQKLPSQWRHDVTSAGGTTEAAVDILMSAEGTLPRLYQDAIRAAIKRAQSL